MTAISVVGAKGGQGATTVAAVLAVTGAAVLRTTLVTSDVAGAAALLGLPAIEANAGIVEVTSRLAIAVEPLGIEGLVVADGGCARRPDRSYSVLRGPCYLALARLAADPQGARDGVILLEEPGRSLTARDVIDVLGVPVVATVPVSPAVARAVDAGLLLERLPPPPRGPRPGHTRTARCPALRPLIPPRHGPRPPMTTDSPQDGTDLPLSLCVSGVERRRVGGFRRDRRSSMHVSRVWGRRGAGGDAEHRPACARRCRLLPRRGRHFRRGLLHGTR